MLSTLHINELKYESTHILNKGKKMKKLPAMIWHFFWIVIYPQLVIKTGGEVHTKKSSKHSTYKISKKIVWLMCQSLISNFYLQYIFSSFIRLFFLGSGSWFFISFLQEIKLLNSFLKPSRNKKCRKFF